MNGFTRHGLTPIPITCRRCGGVEGACVPGKGPHAYRLNCKACGAFNKWASALDVEPSTEDDLVRMFKNEESKAIEAGKVGSFKDVMAHTVKMEKIKDKLS